MSLPPPPPAASSRPPASDAAGAAGAMGAPSAQTATAGGARRRRKHGRVITIVVGAVVLLGVILVVADFGVRAYAEARVSQAVTSNLPSNVTGDVEVHIGGGPFLLQYATGTFSEVTLTSSNLQVGGVSAQVTIVANNVSTDQTKPVPRASATVTLDQAAVNSFLSIPGSNEITLGDGTVGYSGQLQVFGLTLGYVATATAMPQGPDVLLTPTGAQLTAGSASFDVSGALKTVVSKPISICVAKYLPVGVQLTSITPSNGQVAVTAEATNITLSEDALKTTGSCG